MSVPVNITINPACNGFIIFITPKFIEGAGDRVFVATTLDVLAEIVEALADNRHPGTGEQLEWPYKP